MKSSEILVKSNEIRAKLFMTGIKPTEAAQKLGITVNSFRVRLSRGRGFSDHDKTVLTELLDLSFEEYNDWLYGGMLVDFRDRPCGQMRKPLHAVEEKGVNQMVSNVKTNELRAEIIRQGLSQHEVADAIGVSIYSLRKKICGEVRFSDEERAALAKLLGLSYQQCNEWLYNCLLPEYPGQDDL